MSDPKAKKHLRLMTEVLPDPTPPGPAARGSARWPP
jgi:hypothetical protein